jgi:hypothetical protein
MLEFYTLLILTMLMLTIGMRRTCAILCVAFLGMIPLSLLIPGR